MTEKITSVSKETRLFPPPSDFAARARIATRETYATAHAASLRDPDAFWRREAEELVWFKRPTKVLTGDLPRPKWFEDGTTNLSTNCLDRHLSNGRRHKAAIVWESEQGETRVLTYAALHRETVRAAAGLRALGVKKGDRVAIYMGMVPEAVVAMLACARIGAVHSVIFGGFAADAIRDRVNDAGAKVIITQDGAFRRGDVVALKPNVDKALPQCPTVEKVVVLRRAKNAITMESPRDIEWDALVTTTQENGANGDAEELPAEHPLFILYTSGTTGKPKGVVHSTGGYMVATYASTKYVFDIRDDDLYWCTADVGWVTGHSYIVYGPLANGATALMYEGALNTPDAGRPWEVIERHGVTIFYTAPTAIRAFVRAGDQFVDRSNLSSLRLIGTVGEPINPEAWIWYREKIGGGRCPIVDTWWQTETGAMMVTPLPGAIGTKPGSCTLPFFGVSPKVLREDGSEAAPNEGGYLVIDRPWPSMLRGVWGDDARFEQYFAKYPGKYFTGDGARRDEDGYLWVMGRVDDVVNVSGHRLGTAEIESVLVAHPQVAEAAVVSRPDELKGEALVGFVTLKAGRTPSPELSHELREHVAAEIGRFARPDEVRFADALPKTRSGKIMRRLLKDLAAGRSPTGDTSTLEDLNVLAKLRGTDE